MTARSLGRSAAALASSIVLPILVAVPATAQEPVSRMVEVEGDSFHVMTAGFEHLERGRAAIVFESGAGGTPVGTWRPVFGRVAEFAPAVAYDRSGIGRSPWDGQPPTLERRAEQLQKLLIELEVPPPYVLVGHSWGGALVRSFAGRYPEHVAGLVYVDPADFSQTLEEQRAVFAEISPGAGEAEWEAARQAYIQLQRSLAAQGPPGVRAEMDLATGVMQKKLADRGLGTAPDVPLAVLLAAKYQPPPPGVTLPVDLRALRAAQLGQAMRKMSGWVLDAPDGLFAVARQAGHFVQHDDPDLVVHAIRTVAFPDVSRQLKAALAEGGPQALEGLYRTLRQRYPEDRFHENLLNRLGYELLRSGRVDEAIAVFELNVEEYPGAWNPHDSLGDAYRAAGRTEEAIESYQRSLELNPNSPSGQKLRSLEGR